MRRSLSSSFGLAFASALVVAGVASCGGNDSAAPACTPGASGVDTGGDFPSSVDAYCMVHLAGGAVGPNAAATPYDVNTPLFSDYATKYRTVWLPPKTSVAYNADGRFEFPVGTVITKSFGFPADMRVANAPVKWLETRVLIRSTSGWVGSELPKWDARAEDDDRVGRRGDRHVFVHRRGGQYPDAELPRAEPGRVPEVPRERRRDDHARPERGAAQSRLRVCVGHGERASRTGRVWSADGAPAPAKAPKLAVFDDPSTGDTISAEGARVPPGQLLLLPQRHREARTTGPSMLSNTETDLYTMGVCKPPVAARKGRGERALRHRSGPPLKSRSCFIACSQRRRAS